jgi:hypothetical protein
MMNIRDFNAFPLLVAALAMGGLACAGMVVREAESNLGAKLHAHEMTFEVTASNQAVDLRVADAVNAAIEQTVAERGRMPSERLEPLAYAVVMQTGIAPGLQRLCGNRTGGLCCSLLCRVMRTDAKAVMIEARDDLDREFRVDSLEPRVDPTRRCAGGSLSQRLQCLRGLVTAEPSHVKVGPFLVSGRITSAMAKAFDVDLQIVRVQVQSAREEQANREAKEQEAHREWLCNVKVDEAGAAVERWRPDVARVRVVWENAKSSCGDLWSPIHHGPGVGRSRRATQKLPRRSRETYAVTAAEEPPAQRSRREEHQRSRARSVNVGKSPTSNVDRPAARACAWRAAAVARSLSIALVSYRRRR